MVAQNVVRQKNIKCNTVKVNFLYKKQKDISKYYGRV
jgi:hypothetical protein